MLAKQVFSIKPHYLPLNAFLISERSWFGWKLWTWNSDFFIHSFSRWYRYCYRFWQRKSNGISYEEISYDKRILWKKNTGNLICFIIKPLVWNGQNTLLHNFIQLNKIVYYTTRPVIGLHETRRDRDFEGSRLGLVSGSVSSQIRESLEKFSPQRN